MSLLQEPWLRSTGVQGCGFSCDLNLRKFSGTWGLYGIALLSFGQFTRLMKNLQGDHVNKRDRWQRDAFFIPLLSVVVVCKLDCIGTCFANASLIRALVPMCREDFCILRKRSFSC